MKNNHLLDYQRLISFLRLKRDELSQDEFWDWVGDLDPQSREEVINTLSDPAYLLQDYQTMPDLDGQAYHWKDEHRNWDERLLQFDKDGNPINWRTWFCRMGRGAGKTHAASTNVHLFARYLYPGRDGMLVGPDHKHVREVMIEGESGLLATAPPDFVPKFQPMYSRVIWPNGSKAIIYTSDDPEAIRGPSLYWAWGDELAKWKSEKSYKNMASTLRNRHEYGNRLILTTSPIASQKWVRAIESDPATITSVATSFDNAVGLDEGALADWQRRVDSGDEKAREEYLGVWLEEDGQLWTLAELDAISNKSSAVSLKDFVEHFDVLLLSIDPGGRRDLSGIVLIGKLGKTYWVLGDWSMPGTKEKWELQVLDIVKSYMRNGDRVVVETNKHQDAEIDLRRMLNEKSGKSIYVEGKHQPPGQGKTYRAQRAQQLYEQDRVKHFRVFSDLHQQMERFYEIVASSNQSPDRVDALCTGLNYLTDLPAPSMDIIITSLTSSFDH